MRIIDSAIEGLVDAIWFNQGQVCCAGSRLLVQEGSRSGSMPSSARG
jgi:acyl-CoA reductase-like NAD-dependent aldehyde dehydrogenase